MKKRKAFTLIEMIFAISILGVIGGSSITFVGQLYINYGHQQEISKLEQNSNQLLTQLSKYIYRSIPSSIMEYSGALTTIASLNSANYQSIETINDGNLSQNTLVWLDVDKESIKGNGVTPYYNKWINLDTSINTTINSVNNNFLNIPSVSEMLLNKGVGTTTEALYFTTVNKSGSIYDRFYSKSHTSLFEIASYDSVTSLTLVDTPIELGEFFNISNTAIALKLVGTNLFLIRDFQPWQLNGVNQETFMDGNNLLLMEEVDSIKYWYESGMLRLQVCLISNYVIGDNSGVPEYARTCKERALRIY